jgi:hypothetical protein
MPIVSSSIVAWPMAPMLIVEVSSRCRTDPWTQNGVELAVPVLGTVVTVFPETL